MAVVPQLKKEELDEFGDITSNLPSLQFESVLSAEEKELLSLRKRSHALTVHACAQATYFVSVLNEARQIKTQLHNPENRRASRLLQEVGARDPLLVGIIGCGRLGSHIAHCLLTFGEVNPEDIKIATRRPETLTELQEKGVICTSDSLEVARSVHILFLCVLPSQFPALADELRGHLSVRSIIYSFISTLPLSKLQRLLEFNNIIRPDFMWDPSNADKPWDYNMEVTAMFAERDMLEQTCPLSLKKHESVVSTSERFAEQLVYAFVNMCSFMRVNKEDSVDIVNAVMLGHTSKNPLQEKLTTQDFTAQLKDGVSTFPKFNLCALEDKDTPLTTKLVDNQHIREKFVDKYCSIFQQYLDWKTLALQQAKKQINFSYDQ